LVFLAWSRGAGRREAPNPITGPGPRQSCASAAAAPPRRML